MIEYFIRKWQFKKIGDKSKKTIFVARLDEKIILDTDELCQRVADRSTLAKGEMRLALDMYCEMAKVALSEGRSVRLGDLGVLHPTINAKAQDSKEKVTVDTIKRVTCAFRMSNVLSRLLNGTPLRKIKRPNEDI